MSHRQADRLEALPPYIFSEINAIKADAEKRGIQLLSLGIGDPDKPTPQAIVEKLKEGVGNPANHVYSPYEGTKAFRAGVARWMESRFGVTVNPDREVVALIGSKEGIAHFPVAFCNPGDTCLFPSPGYPVFETSITLAGGKAVPIPLRPENAFLPDPKELDRLCAEHSPKYVLLNFPSNPTSATASLDLLTEIVAIAKRRGTVLLYDNAYSEIYFDDAKKPPSILQVPGARDVALELQSFSKTFNMTGWRIAFAVGNDDLAQGLLRAKTNIDSGPLLAVQEAAVYALDHAAVLTEPIRRLYTERKLTVEKGLRRLGIEYFAPEATFFLWAKVPGQMKSMDFTKALIEKEGLVVTPGIGFGKEGEGFFRLALTVDTPRIEDALARLARFLGK